MQWSDVTFLDSIYRFEQYPDSSLPVFAFAGRSNVGKSTLLNTVWNRKNQARVSSRPGKTRSPNLFLVGGKCYFIDLPGYGYAGGPHNEKMQWKHLIDKLLLEHPAFCRLFLLIDIRHSLQNNDRDMFDFINFHKIPRSIVLTKSDKLSRPRQQKQVQYFTGVLDLSPNDLILFSSTGKKGIHDVRNIIMDDLQKK